jgi:hypothetical protein
VLKEVFDKANLSAFLDNLREGKLEMDDIKEKFVFKKIKGADDKKDTTTDATANTTQQKEAEP